MEKTVTLPQAFILSVCMGVVGWSCVHIFGNEAQNVKQDAQHDQHEADYQKITAMRDKEFESLDTRVGKLENHAMEGCK